MSLVTPHAAMMYPPKDDNRTQYVCGFMFEGPAYDPKALLMVRKETGPDYLHGKWNGLGGKMEPTDGNNPNVAMYREFLEEADIKCPPHEWEYFCFYEGKDYIVYFFKVFVKQIPAYPSTVPNTSEVLRKWSMDEINQGRCPMVPNLKWLIPAALDRDLAGLRAYDGS